MNKWLCGLLALGITQIAFAGNYLLKIDGVTHDIDLGEETVVHTGKGDIKVSIEKKAIAKYTIDGISFEHPSTLNPSVSVLSEEVKQVLLARANGDFFLVQLYKGIDGSILVPLLETEMTKEEVAIGYKKTARDIELQLDNGETLKGRFIQTQKGTDNFDRYIVGCPTKTGGVVAVIQTSDLAAEGQKRDDMMVVMKSLKANCTKK